MIPLRQKSLVLLAVADRLTRVAGALDLEETIGSRIQAERLNCTVETSLLSNEIQGIQLSLLQSMFYYILVVLN